MDPFSTSFSRALNFCRTATACHGRLPSAKLSYAQNGKQPIRLPNGLLYPRAEVEQKTHSGDEIVAKQLLFVMEIS